jgi:hypothetical protein
VDFWLPSSGNSACSLNHVRQNMPYQSLREHRLG